jgi:hypothetical protein
MLRKVHDQFLPYDGPAPEGARALERDGHFVLRGENGPAEVAELRAEVEEVYRRVPADMRDGRVSPQNAEMFRYELFNRSAACQRALARPNVLAILEPLLGGDCHVIACTAWRNPPGNEHAPMGQEWHVDGGPHIPRASGTPWPKDVPYPIFVVAAHLYLADVELTDGPTAVVPGSHTTGRLPPPDQLWNERIVWNGRASVAHVARAGDVGFFVSDVWHRRLPPQPTGRGRFFVQTNYGRREIAQRVLPTSQVNHVHPDAEARAATDRERRLIGLHPQVYYDG